MFSASRPTPDGTPSELPSSSGSVSARMKASSGFRGAFSNGCWPMRPPPNDALKPTICNALGLNSSPSANCAVASSPMTSTLRLPDATYASAKHGKPRESEMTAVQGVRIPGGFILTTGLDGIRYAVRPQSVGIIHDADECRDETLVQLHGRHVVRVPCPLDEVLPWFS
jgi:hypothetical protein